MGWLIALGVLTLLAILPLGARASYSESGLEAWLVLGPVRIRIYPGKKKKAHKQKPVKEKGTKKQAEPENKKGGSIKDFLWIVDTAWDFLRDLRKKLKVDILEMRLTMAGEDPCDLAVNYGRAWAALGNLVPLLERLFVIKKRDLSVSCDFQADQTRVFARIQITLTVGQLLWLASRYGIRILKNLNDMKKSKGGVNE